MDTRLHLHSLHILLFPSPSLNLPLSSSSSSRVPQEDSLRKKAKLTTIITKGRLGKIKRAALLDLIPKLLRSRKKRLGSLDNLKNSYVLNNSTLKHFNHSTIKEIEEKKTTVGKDISSLDINTKKTLSFCDLVYFSTLFSAKNSNIFLYIHYFYETFFLPRACTHNGSYFTNLNPVSHHSHFTYRNYALNIQAFLRFQFQLEDKSKQIHLPRGFDKKKISSSYLFLEKAQKKKLRSHSILD